MATGGDIRSASLVDVHGESWIVALAGTVLQAADGAGRRRWSLPRRVISRVIAAGDLTGSGRTTILARGTQRELLLLDASTGHQRWSWWAPEGTFINEAGAVLLLPLERGHRLLVAPIYGGSILAFDLVGDGPVRVAWELVGDWDAGFGPSLIAADMDGTGSSRLVLSSRRGDIDRTHAGQHTSAETVLGRRHGRMYQAVVDVDDGAILREVMWAPNPRGHRCARPYGLLTAVPFEPGGRPGIVMACCQVEEYIAVTRQHPDGTLDRAWSRFIEKDWPRDRQELRVHPDSVRDLTGAGRPELVSALWDGRSWRTSVQGLGSGRDRAGDRLLDRVLWGTLQRPDTGVVLVVGEATLRAVDGPATLELVDGATLDVIDRVPGATVITSAGGPLPPHVAFMAERRGLSRVHVDGGEAVVIRTADGILRAWWVDADARAQRARLGGATDVIVDGGPGWTLVSDVTGRVRPIGPPFGPARPGRVARMAGRLAAIVAAPDHDGPLVGVELPGGVIRLGRPGVTGSLDAAPVSGTRLSLHLDASGGIRDRAVTRQGSDGIILSVLDGPAGSIERAQVVLDAPLDRPALWLADGSLLLTLRTGTHTLVTEAREADGRLRWRLDAGAYLHAPTTAVVDGVEVVVLDDHGVLHMIEAAGRAGMQTGIPEEPSHEPLPLVRWRRDWTAAYTQPIVGPFLDAGRPAILRASGIHGLELLDTRGRRRWRMPAPLWCYATGEAVVARASGRHVLVAGRRDGSLDGIDVRDGRRIWQLPLVEALDQVALAIVDLDGRGDDSLLVGLPDGRLLCLDGVASTPGTRWSRDVGAGVSTIVPVVQVGRPGTRRATALVLATVDGRVHILDDHAASIRSAVMAGREASDPL